MRAGQYQFTEQGWTLIGGEEPSHPDLVAVFSSAEPAVLRGAMAALRAGFPEAQIVGSTTSGELIDGRVLDGSIVAVALQFDTAHVHAHSVKIGTRRDSFGAGRRLGEAIAAPALKGVLLLAEGIDCDGSQLLSGLCDVIGDDVPVFGGLAGDGIDFVVTRVAANGPFESGQAVAVGFYGKGLTIVQGLGCGWTAERTIGAISNSSGSIIYEIDHRPALDVLRQAARLSKQIAYRELLTAPLWIADPARQGGGIVRTVVGIDEARGSLVMAGDLPRNGVCSLMGTSTEGLVEAAAEAAAVAQASAKSGLAFLVSCVGRKQMLGAAAPAEALAVKQVLRDMLQIGFYAYGEIARSSPTSRLHNQTMCITILDEAGR